MPLFKLHEGSFPDRSCVIDVSVLAEHHMIKIFSTFWFVTGFCYGLHQLQTEGVCLIRDEAYT